MEEGVRALDKVDEIQDEQGCEESRVGVVDLIFLNI